MTLKEHIDNIRNGLERRQFTSETAVRQGIINPLLGQLGWPTSKTQIVFPEYTVEGGKVDYALCHPSAMPRIFIEAKQVGKLDGAERQLFEYAVHQGVSVVILTDGQKWIFFYPPGEGTYEERKVIELDLVIGDRAESANFLNRYLSYESVQTNEAFAAIREDYENFSRQRELARHLPEVWHKLLHKKNRMLLQTMIEDTKKVCRYTPTEEEVLAFLKSLTSVPQEDPVLPIHASSVPSVPDPQRKKSRQLTRLVVTMPDGEIIECSKIRDTFATVIEKLGVEKVAALDIIRQKIPLVSASEYTGYAQRQSGSYYISVDATTIDKKRDLMKIAKGLGVELKVEIIPKE
ncbi:MAG: type I restriction enzyme HsdR N-terminal domain-containing protein [Candidatus Poribacteria bacterium]|nr:type I restriction enzyme HsdR N-terminal domain-containing protein [Candidatus Poribacteria bacterium]